jgi:hypothetical protein
LCLVADGQRRNGGNKQHHPIHAQSLLEKNCAAMIAGALAAMQIVAVCVI